MNIQNFIGIIFVLFMVPACSFVGGANSVDEGFLYMDDGKYEEAEIVFRKAIRVNSKDDAARYYLGRALLAQNMAVQALPHFRKAAFLVPGNLDYQFWLGVAYGKTGDFKSEGLQYERTLKIDSQYAPANLYLGHLMLQEGKYKQALKSYDAVLLTEPTNGDALYNRALILDIERKNEAAKKAWLAYLELYSAGQFSSKATNHLNALGDFSYENHYIGRQVITIPEVKFSDPWNKVHVSSTPSLHLVGMAMSNIGKGNLQIVVYVKNDAQLARQRALEIKKILHELVPSIAQNRISISWFGISEKVVHDENEYSKDESVRLFLTDWK